MCRYFSRSEETAGLPACSGVAAEAAIQTSLRISGPSGQEGQTHMPKYDIVFSELGRGVANIAEQDMVVAHM
jgi:hypothetical protein